MSRRHAGLLGGLAAIWGASYLLIKYALEDFEPAVVVWGRLVFALLALYAVLAIVSPAQARLAARDLRRRPLQAALLGALAVAIPFALIALGEQHVPSGLTAVLIAPSPIFVAALAPLLDASERASLRAALGMVVALVGVAVLVGFETADSTPELLGSVAIVLAAFCYALGGFIVKARYADFAPIVSSTVSITAATVLVTPAALLAVPAEVPGLRAVLSLAVLGVVGTALAFVIFYDLIAAIGAGRAVLVTYLAPGFALFYGAWLLDEQITLTALAGLALILAGVALASGRRAGP